MSRAELPSRRRFICASGVILSTVFLPVHTLAQIGNQSVKVHLTDFLSLSEKLTGYKGLNEQLASRYLDAFMTLFIGFETQFLSDKALQRKVLHAWYTGTVGPNEQDQVMVVAYKNALMYRPTAYGLPTPTYCFQGELWFSELPPGITKEPNFPITF